MSTASLSLPPIEVLAAAADAMATEAQLAGDRPLLNAVNKAALQLHEGTAPIPTIGGWLLESRTRPGVVHRIGALHGCSCEAAVNARTCWHVQLMAIVERAATVYTMPALVTMPEGDVLDTNGLRVNLTDLDFAPSPRGELDQIVDTIDGVLDRRARQAEAERLMNELYA